MFFLLGQSAFKPSDRPSLIAWYDFTNAAYLTLVSTAITQALDRSGNGNHTGVQGTSTARPTFASNQINGLSCATWDGGDTLALPSALYTLSNGPSTIFIVGKRASASGAIENMFSLAIVAAGTNRTVMRFDATEQLTGFNCLAGTTISRLCTTTNFSIHRFRRTGTTQAVSVNNATEATNTSATDETGIDDGHIGSKLGSSQFLTGSIAEILVYNRSLSASEMIQDSRYFNGKYGIAIS